MQASHAAAGRQEAHELALQRGLAERTELDQKRTDRQPRQALPLEQRVELVRIDETELDGQLTEELVGTALLGHDDKYLRHGQHAISQGDTAERLFALALSLESAVELVLIDCATLDQKSAQAV